MYQNKWWLNSPEYFVNFCIFYEWRTQKHRKVNRYRSSLPRFETNFDECNTYCSLSGTVGTYLVVHIYFMSVCWQLENWKDPNILPPSSSLSVPEFSPVRLRCWLSSISSRSTQTLGLDRNNQEQWSVNVQSVSLFHKTFFHTCVANVLYICPNVK